MPASPACSSRMKREQLRCARWPCRRSRSGCSGGRSSTTNTRASSQLQARDDLGARLRIGGGGERDARHVGEALVQHATAAIYSGRKSWPHCETQCASSIANSASFARACEQLETARRQQPLGRDVEQVELARQESRARRRRGFARSASNSATPRARPLRAVPRPGPASARSAARRRRRCRRATRPESGSTATCRRRSASAPARRRRRSTCSTMSACAPRKAG